MKKGIKVLVFDVDGVLIEADGKIRIVKYKKLFKDSIKLVKSKEYGGATWIFEEMKKMYDKGIDISPRHYKLIEKETPKILKELSKKYLIVACSMAHSNITLKKLKKTKIAKYFDSITEKDKKYLSKWGNDVAFIDDRFQKDLNKKVYFIKYNYGQHKDRNLSDKADRVINSLRELIIE